MVLGALGQPASSMPLSMHENTNEPNTLWLVVAALTIGIFAFFCGFAVGFRSFSKSLQRGSNYLVGNEDAAALEAKRRRYLSSPLSECSGPDLWMQLNHHDDSPVEADVSQHGGCTCWICNQCSAGW